MTEPGDTKLDYMGLIKELWQEIKLKTEEIRRRDKVLLMLGLYIITGELRVF